jgi:hypothetical protein
VFASCRLKAAGSKVGANIYRHPIEAMIPEPAAQEIAE